MSSSKLKRLLERQAQLKAQIQQAKAQERSRERKLDTRRKLLIGAAILHQIEQQQWPESKLKAMMDAFLTRPEDRRLFNLPIPDESNAPVAQKPPESTSEPKRDPQPIDLKSAQSSPSESVKTKPLAEPIERDLEAEFNL